MLLKSLSWTEEKCLFFENKFIFLRLQEEECITVMIVTRVVCNLHVAHVVMIVLWECPLRCRERRKSSDIRVTLKVLHSRDVIQGRGLS